MRQLREKKDFINDSEFISLITNITEDQFHQLKGNLLISKYYQLLIINYFF